MERFGQTYELACSMLGRKCFEKWSPNYQAKLEALFAEAGPDDKQAQVLDSIHYLLGTPGMPAPVKSPPPIWERGPRHAHEHKAPPREPTAAQYADLLIDFAKASLTSPTEPIHDRCALLKMLKHFYFVSRAGNQSIWVADNPVAYDGFPFNVIGGKSERAIRRELMHNTEIFGPGIRQLFSDAFTVGRKWSADAAAKLSAPDAHTIDLVKRWFGVGANDNLDSVVQWASMSFGWISQAFNSKHVVISDDPVRRAGRGKLPLASTWFGKEEAMQVIYVYKPFFEFGRKSRTGGMSKLWLAALTIVHELAHKEVGVDDKRYDFDGIKPGGRHLSAEDAIWNAESYAYFATDLAGALPRRDFAEAYR